MSAKSVYAAASALSAINLGAAISGDTVLTGCEESLTASITASNGILPFPGGASGVWESPMRAAERSAVDTVVWLTGALDILGEEPPTKEQWERIKPRLQEQVKDIVKARLLGY